MDVLLEARAPTPLEFLAEAHHQPRSFVRTQVLVCLLAIQTRFAPGVAFGDRHATAVGVLRTVAEHLARQHRRKHLARPFDQIAADDHGDGDAVGQLIRVVEEIGPEFGEPLTKHVDRRLGRVAWIVDQEDVAPLLQRSQRRLGERRRVEQHTQRRLQTADRSSAFDQLDVELGIGFGR